METQNNLISTFERNSWFLNEPFRQGLVYQQLTNMKYKYVLGLDVGHGETVAYLAVMKAKERDDKTVEIYPDIDKIVVNDAGDARIATMIGFIGERVIIGREARKIPGFYQHFKTEPARWKHNYRAYTFGNLMEAFIRELWKGIKRHNPKVEQAAENDELLIAVGCPSSPAWTGTEAVLKYRALVERATGCKHVSVLAESTAAIMSAVLDVNEINKDCKEEKNIRMNRGLAVIDAGSSTIDFTYVLLGKKLITRSLAVGGHDLDEQILAAAIENKKTDTFSIPEEQIPDIMVQIRQIKEEFFPDQISLGHKSLQIWGRNAQGIVDMDVDSGVYLNFAANAELMDCALTRKAIQQDPFKPVLSWAQQCRNFVRDCRALIGDGEDNRLLCDKVILTGGTSKVQMFRSIVEEEYKDCEVIYSRDSSASVAKGLCFAKCMEIKGGDVVEGYKKEADQLAEKDYDLFIKELADYMAKEVCSDIQGVIAKHSVSKEKVIAGALLNEINNRVRSNKKLTGEICQQKVEELFLKYFRSAQEECHKKVNIVSKSIYGADASSIPEIPLLTEAEMKQMASKLDISGAINNTWLNTIVAGINFSAIRNVLWLLGMLTLEIPPLSTSLLALAVLSDFTTIQQKVMQFILNNKTVIPGWMLKRIGKSVTDPKKRSKLESDSARKTVNNMKNQGILKKEFVTCVSQQAEMDLGKVLFLVYEEEPNTK